MLRRMLSRRLYPTTTALGVIVAAIVIFSLSSGGGDPAGPVASVRVSVGNFLSGRPIEPGFVGLSLEYPALLGYAGGDPRAVNPVFEALLGGLAPGQSPVLRVGGDSTDWTWWPVHGIRRPPGIKYSLRPRWFEVARALARSTGARLVLGVNLEAGNRRVTAAEGQALVSRIGRRWVQALEIGNEPELYASFGWYKAPDGRNVPGRGPGYNLPQFIQDFTRYGDALPHSVPLAGPATGGPKWRARLEQFMPAPRLGLVSLHSYPLTTCTLQKGKPMEATIPNLLSPFASTGLAGLDAPDALIAHSHALPLRVDELNSVSCGGKLGISNSFAAALWSLGTLFELARVGVDGINVHTFPGARYQPFAFFRAGGRWHASVKPLYYGLLAFARAAPPGSWLEPVSVVGRSGAIRGWATRGIDGLTRLVLINYSVAGPAPVVATRLAGAGGAGALVRLQAPSVYATTGVTLGGQSFGASTGTGLLAGAPRTISVRPVGGRYVFSLPAGSAAMLTVR